MTTTETKTTSNITITKSIKGTVHGENCNIIVKIQIGGSCAKSNGHEDFSITGTAYLKGRPMTERNMVSGGAMGDTIAKIAPKYKIFNNLHLCDLNGVPMHASSNMAYHLKSGFNSVSIDDANFKNQFCEYYRINNLQFDELNKIKDLNSTYFTLKLQKLGIFNQWKKEALKAIEILEKESGETFKTDFPEYNLKYQISEDDKKEIEQKEQEGFYTDIAIKNRELQRLKDLNKAMIEKVNADFDAKVSKYEKEKDICLELIKQGFEISPRTGNIKGAIYYNHTNELNFNWSTEKIELSKIESFIKNIDNVKFKGLIISDDKKQLTTI